MVVSIVENNSNIIVPLMVFVGKILFQELHKKIDWLTMECARSIRLHVELPLNMWAKFVNIVVYFINSSVSLFLWVVVFQRKHELVRR